MASNSATVVNGILAPWMGGNLAGWRGWGKGVVGGGRSSGYTPTYGRGDVAFGLQRVGNGGGHGFWALIRAAMLYVAAINHRFEED